MILTTKSKLNNKKVRVIVSFCGKEPISLEGVVEIDNDVDIGVLKLVNVEIEAVYYIPIDKILYIKEGKY